MTVNLDLFEAPAPRGHAERFANAFASWRAAAQASMQVRRGASFRVYQDMWSAFSGWCLGQSPTVTLENLAELDLQRFLGSRHGRQGGELHPRHAWRLLTLIDRVLQHRALEEDRQPNTAARDHLNRIEAIRLAHAGGAPPLDYLDAAEARQLVAFLGQARPSAAEARRVVDWQQLRNVAAVALHLGAGLTPLDLQGLTLDSPVVAGGRRAQVPWKLKVPGNGNRAARETPIAPWAGRILRDWLDVRANVPRLNVAAAGAPAAGADKRSARQTGFLFPGRSGQRWGKMAHYEAVAAVLEASGVDPPGAGSGGAFRLRHTFALRQLRKNKPAEDVARWMGIVLPAQMDRYRAVLDRYEEAF